MMKKNEIEAQNDTVGEYPFFADSRLMPCLLIYFIYPSIFLEA